MPRTRSIGWAQLKLGLIAIVAIVLSTILILAVGGQGGFPWQRYPLKARFVNVQGMKTGAVVRIGGKDVGKVVSVEFSGDQIEIGLEVSRDVRALITDKSVASMGTLSLLGEPLIDIRPASDGTPLEDGAYLRTDQSAGMIADAAASASTTLEQVRQMMTDVQAGRGTMGKLFTEDALYSEFTALLESANRLTATLQSGKGTAASLLNDPTAYASMKASLGDLQAMTERIRRGEGALGRLLQSDAMVRSLEATTANAETVTGRLARGEGTAGKLLTEDALYTRLDGITGRLDALVNGLGAGKGTAGQLLQDQRLYDNMNQAATSLNELIAAIKKDPKKYLTVRVSIFGG